MRKVVFVLCLLFIVFTSVEKAFTSPAFSYSSKVDTGSDTIIIDVRAQQLCLKGSLSGARCLPASDFFGPHGRLVNFPDLSWLLGTVGLSGSEHVLVVGNSPMKRDFVAGIIYLAGQQKVTILSVSFAELEANSIDFSAGEKRANTRYAVHSRPFRAELIIFRNELDALLTSNKLPDLLDGRSEKEYWGENIRSLRGGHVPGAQLLTATDLRALLKKDPQSIPNFSAPIVYAHNTLESVAYFSLLRAGFGLESRVFLAGWADWAMELSLPVDSLSYPDINSLNKSSNPEMHTQTDNYWVISITIILAGLILMVWGFSFQKRKT
jgi:thiosulfate/3-mercaptopyruvate sulfurtransferase